MDNLTQLLKENEKLIYSIINKYRNYFEIEDLYQEAVIGLIKANKKFNPSLEAKFSTYAYPYILGQVIKYVNDNKGIKTNRKQKILYLKIIKAREILAQRLMKYPSNYELSLFLEIDEDIINDVLLANQNIDSLDRLIKDDSKNLEVYNFCGYQDKNIENFALRDELGKLTEDEYNLIVARYYEDMSQRECGMTLGMYQVEVSRKEQKILKKLRDGVTR